MKKSLRILVDLDGIVADFFALLLSEYNRRNTHKETLTISDIRSWEMTEFVKDPKLLFRIFRARGFFRKLTPVSGAVEALKALQEQGHEIVIVSTPCTPHSAAEKIRWCAKYLPFINAKNVFVCHRKSMIQGDVLIDDALHNAKDYRSIWNHSHIYTVAYNHNHPKPGEEYIYDGRFGSLAHSECAWAEIVAAISKIAE